MVPSLMEGLEDVDELSLVEAVEVGHDGVEFPDVFLALVRIKGAASDADPLSPFGETVVRGREPRSKRNYAVAERTLFVQSRNGKRIDNEEVELSLNETSSGY